MVVDDGLINFDEAEPPERDTGDTRKTTWAETFFYRLDPPTKELVLTNLARLKSFSTTYSGVGFFEAMVRQLFTSLGVALPRSTHVYDILPICIDVLTRHCEDDPTSPSCVFGDLTKRVPRMSSARWP